LNLNNLVPFSPKLNSICTKYSFLKTLLPIRAIRENLEYTPQYNFEDIAPLKADWLHPIGGVDWCLNNPAQAPGLLANRLQ